MVLALPELVVDQTRVLLPHRDPRIDLLPPQSFHGPPATAGILRDPHPQPVRLRGRTLVLEVNPQALVVMLAAEHAILPALCPRGFALLHPREPSSARAWGLAARGDDLALV